MKMRHKVKNTSCKLLVNFPTRRSRITLGNNKFFSYHKSLLSETGSKDKISGAKRKEGYDVNEFCLFWI